MLHDIGLEIPGARDPNLNWMTAAKGRQWAVRRARTSFADGRRKKSVVKSSKGSEVTMDKDTRRTTDIPVSDSEKVSVSILGQHFSESLEIVPIKKRRFLFVSSPSSPLQSSYSDDSDHLLESQPASYQESLAYNKHHDRRFIASKRTSLNDVIEEATDAADFSGISILATAACNSEVVADTIHSGRLVSKGNSSREDHLEDTDGDESHSSCKDKMWQLHSLKDLQENHNVSMENCLTFVPAEDDTKCDGLQNQKNFMGSLQNASDKIKSSTGSRLHWDLNTEMDAWNNNFDDVISEPLATDLVAENGNSNEKLEGSKTCECQVENGEKSCPTEHGESLMEIAGIARDHCAFVADEILEKPDLCNGLSVSNYEKAKHCHSSIEVEHDLDANAVSLVNFTEEAKLIHNQGNNIFINDKAKGNASSRLEGETEPMLSHLPFCENVNGDCNTHACKFHPNMVQSISKPVRDENVSIDASNADNSFDDHCPANAGQSIQITTTQIEKHGLLNIVENDNQSPILAEKATSLLFDGDMGRNLVAACGTSGETVHSDGLDITNGNCADKSSGTLCMSPSPLNAHQRKSPGSCDPNELTSEATCAAKYEETATKMKVDDNNGFGAKASVPVSAVVSMAKTNASLVDGAVDTQEADKHMDSSVNSHCDHKSDASQVDGVQVTGLEKDNLLGDDDSQFEDGEFRETVLHDWGDGIDEGESEHVDYGSESDNRENDIFEADSALPATSFSSENVACKESNMSDADAPPTGKDSQVALSQPPSKCSSKSDGSDAVQGKKTIGVIGTIDHFNHLALIRKRKQRNVTDVLASGPGSDKPVRYNGCHNEGDSTREHSTSERTKLSGWDLLPEGRRHTEDSFLDPRIGSVKQDETASSLDVFGDDESSVRSGSSFREGLSSQVERPNYSDESYRKDKFYPRLSRSNNHDSLDAKAEKNAGASKSSGWGGSFRHTQGRGRDKHWFDSSNRHGNRHHDSPGYYDAPSFARPASRNAAAAAIAKVESNGFVVAPDGTLVKAGGAGTSGRVVRQSANASLQSAHPSLSRWGSQPDRDLACGMQRRRKNSREMSPDRHFIVSRGQVDKHAIEMVRDRHCRRRLDDMIESSAAADHLSARDRSFSPCGRHIHLSHSRTRSSRSRTRSPLRWASPRRRNDIGMNDVPVSRRRSRSPIARMERMRSPHPQPTFEERMITYGSASRTLASSLHASRWVDERKDSSNHPKEHEYKRYSGRSSPVKVFRNHRLDSMDSQGRPKPDDYYHHLHSSSNPEFDGFGRGYKFEDSNNRRGRGGGGKYEVLHSMRQYNIDKNEKRFR
ncbi:unnamed protein product [Musa textilis]